MSETANRRQELTNELKIMALDCLASEIARKAFDLAEEEAKRSGQFPDFRKCSWDNIDIAAMSALETIDGLAKCNIRTLARDLVEKSFDKEPMK